VKKDPAPQNLSEQTGWLKLPGLTRSHADQYGSPHAHQFPPRARGDGRATLRPLRSRAHSDGSGGARAATPGASADARSSRRGRPHVREKTADPRDHETARGLVSHGDRLADPLRAIRHVRTCASTPFRSPAQTHLWRSATHRPPLPGLESSGWMGWLGPSPHSGRIWWKPASCPRGSHGSRSG